MGATQRVITESLDVEKVTSAEPISRRSWIISGVLTLAFLATLSVLAHQENAGPPHMEFELPGHEPATLYLPGNAGPVYAQIPLVPRPLSERPAGVVLVHGHSADRNSVSRLARQMAQNGYLVLSIEVHGHGANRNPFDESFGNSGRDALNGDVRNAVEYLRHSPLVDPARLVVMGHSMGAGAALDYASGDKDLAGSVMISGGFDLWGPARPRNTLFIFAQHDPAFIRLLSTEIGGHLAGTDKPELNKTYGDFGAGTAVKIVQVDHVDHVEIVYSKQAATTIIEWLDGIFGTRRTGPLDLRDPRRVTASIALLLFAVLLVPLGRACALIVPQWERRDGSGWLGLGAVALALLAAMPLVATARPASFLAIEVGPELFSWLGLAGILMLLVMAVAGIFDWRRLSGGLGAILIAAGLSFALIYSGTVAFSVTTHSFTLTPERLLVMAASTLLALPFFLAFELLVRRGGLLISTLTGALGRVLLIVMLFVAMGVGVLPSILSLIAILFIVTFATIEIFAASVYSVSANLLLIALVESAWIAWTVAAFMPIKFMI